MMFQLPSLLDRLCKPFACVAVQARRRPPLVSQEALSQTCWNPCRGRKLARDTTWQRNPEEGANISGGALEHHGESVHRPCNRFIWRADQEERTDTVCTRPIARLSSYSSLGRSNEGSHRRTASDSASERSSSNVMQGAVIASARGPAKPKRRNSVSVSMTTEGCVAL